MLFVKEIQVLGEMPQMWGFILNLGLTNLCNLLISKYFQLYFMAGWIFAVQ